MNPNRLHENDEPTGWLRECTNRVQQRLNHMSDDVVAGIAEEYIEQIRSNVWMSYALSTDNITFSFQWLRLGVLLVAVLFSLWFLLKIISWPVDLATILVAAVVYTLYPVVYMATYASQAIVMTLSRRLWFNTWRI